MIMHTSDDMASAPTWFPLAVLLSMVWLELAGRFVDAS